MHLIYAWVIQYAFPFIPSPRGLISSLCSLLLLACPGAKAPNDVFFSLHRGIAPVLLLPGAASETKELVMTSATDAGD